MDRRLENVKRVLVFTAHADDCEFFCGGIVAALARMGAEITEVIATDNGRGSFELDQASLVTRSREIEAAAAAAVIGKKHVEFLGFPDGFLDDTPKNELRRIFMAWIRKIRPDCVISFDPFASGETHPDHIRVAQAAVEAVGFAHLPLFHPEQAAEGLLPHLTPISVFFSKSHDTDDTIIDISDVIDVKIAAILAHESQMRLTMTEQRMFLESTGRHPALVPLFDVDNPGPAIDTIVRKWALDAAEGLPFMYGEGCRVETVDAAFDGFTLPGT